MILARVTKITVERVFNIGNYQTVRFGMEVSADVDSVDAQAIRELYDSALTVTELSFNDIMTERQRNQQQQQF